MCSHGTVNKEIQGPRKGFAVPYKKTTREVIKRLYARIAFPFNDSKRAISPIKLYFPSSYPGDTLIRFPGSGKDIYYRLRRFHTFTQKINIVPFILLVDCS